MENVFIWGVRFFSVDVAEHFSWLSSVRWGFSFLKIKVSFNFTWQDPEIKSQFGRQVLTVTFSGGVVSAICDT